MPLPPQDTAKGGPASDGSDLLVCFAVAQEVGRNVRATDTRILITGMGQKNAEASLGKELIARKPTAVFTCGFAGGLNPDLKRGDVVFAHDPELNIAEALLALGARPGRFRLSQEIIVRAEEKALMHTLTGADAIEMESVAIRAVCKKAGIPSATIRVILDPAGEDLPVDFNQLMTRGMALSYPRLFWLILRKPSAIRGLQKMQRDSNAAAGSLDRVLTGLLGKTSQ